MYLLCFTLFCILGGILGISPPFPEKKDGNNTEGQIQKTMFPVHPMHQMRTSFKKKYVHYGGRITSTHASGTIEVAATSHVSDLAHNKAALIVSLMVRHMPHDVFSGVTRSHGVGIFTKAETMAVYPENYAIADTPACRGNCHGSCSHTCSSDGRKYASITGLTNTRSVILDHNVLCDSHDPQGHSENIVVHEFAHLVNKYAPSSIKKRLTYVYNYAKQHGVWNAHTYAMGSSAEYWAEATQAFFHATKRLDGPTADMNKCSFNHLCSSEAENRAHLQKHDPWLFDILSHVYTNNKPNTPGGLASCM